MSVQVSLPVILPPALTTTILVLSLLSTTRLNLNFIPQLITKEGLFHQYSRIYHHVLPLLALEIRSTNALPPCSGVIPSSSSMPPIISLVSNSRAWYAVHDHGQIQQNRRRRRRRLLLLTSLWFQVIEGNTLREGGSMRSQSSRRLTTQMIVSDKASKRYIWIVNRAHWRLDEYYWI